MFCKKCGKPVGGFRNNQPETAAETDRGMQEGSPQKVQPETGTRDRNMALVLCLTLGTFGIHSFYAGKMLKGLLQMLTLGGCGLWTVADLLQIITGKYLDGEGRLLYTRTDD